MGDWDEPCIYAVDGVPVNLWDDAPEVDPPPPKPDKYEQALADIEAGKDPED